MSRPPQPPGDPPEGPDADSPDAASPPADPLDEPFDLLEPEAMEEDEGPEEEGSELDELPLVGGEGPGEPEGAPDEDGSPLDEAEDPLADPDRRLDDDLEDASWDETWEGAGWREEGTGPLEHGEPDPSEPESSEPESSEPGRGVPEPEPLPGDDELEEGDPLDEDEPSLPPEPVDWDRVAGSPDDLSEADWAELEAAVHSLPAGRVLVGFREFVALPALGLHELAAEFHTGQEESTLAVEVLSAEGDEVRLRVGADVHALPVLPGGRVSLELILGQTRREVVLILVDHPGPPELVLGRDLIEGFFVVDVAQRFVHSRTQS